MTILSIVSTIQPFTVIIRDFKLHKKKSRSNKSEDTTGYDTRSSFPIHLCEHFEQTMF